MYCCSLNGYQMYRQHVQDREWRRCSGFCCWTRTFHAPFCIVLNRLVEAAGQLPNNENSLRTVAATSEKCVIAVFLNCLIPIRRKILSTKFNSSFATIHNEIASTWFSQASRITTANSNQCGVKILFCLLRLCSFLNRDTAPNGQLV